MANNVKTVIVPERPDVTTGKDVFTLVLGFLGALKLLLAAPPFTIEIPQETFEAVLNLVAWGFVGYGVWKNTYTTHKAKQQKSVLKQAGLK